MRTATIVRWTGSGNLAGLERAVVNLLRDRKMKVSSRSAGGSVLVTGGNPVAVALALQHLPGVAWVAVGMYATSVEGLKASANELGRKYLRPGGRFSVWAEVSSGLGPTSELSGAVTSSLLDTGIRTRVDDSRPDVIFRTTRNSGGFALGVQLVQGPGGRPTGDAPARCLVSGGMHSSVLAWNAVLAGFRVQLVHAKVDDQSVKGVASLYAELSYRVDSSKLSIVVLAGASPADALASWAKGRRGRVYAGFHAGCSERPSSLLVVQNPLYLLPEERFREELAGLSLTADQRSQAWKKGMPGEYVERKFGGEVGDLNKVIDGLK